jgi:hypothetical protein
MTLMAVFPFYDDVSQMNSSNRAAIRLLAVEANAIADF